MEAYKKDDLNTRPRLIQSYQVEKTKTTEALLSELEELLMKSETALPKLNLPHYTEVGNCSCGCGCRGVIGEATNWCYFLCVSAMS